MAEISCLSPPQLSPTRRPLQNLSTNVNITPQKLASGKSAHVSPVKAGTPLTPAFLLSSKKNENYGSEQQTLNPSKKRPIDDVIAEDRDLIRASFSSLINYDPASSDGVEQPHSSVPLVEEPAARLRADTLKLRLQMAMFRVRTNQMRTPFAQLVVPPSPVDVSHPASSSNTLTHQDSVQLPLTPPLRIRSSSGSSTEEDPSPWQHAKEHGNNSQIPLSHIRLDVTRSAVKGDAISGLLELRRAS